MEPIECHGAEELTEDQKPRQMSATGQPEIRSLSKQGKGHSKEKIPEKVKEQNWCLFATGGWKGRWKNPRKKESRGAGQGSDKWHEPNEWSMQVEEAANTEKHDTANNKETRPGRKAGRVWRA